MKSSVFCETSIFFSSLNVSSAVFNLLFSIYKLSCISCFFMLFSTFHFFLLYSVFWTSAFYLLSYFLDLLDVVRYLLFQYLVSSQDQSTTLYYNLMVLRFHFRNKHNQNLIKTFLFNEHQRTMPNSLAASNRSVSNNFACIPPSQHLLAKTHYGRVLQPTGWSNGPTPNTHSWLLNFAISSWNHLPLSTAISLQPVDVEFDVRPSTWLVMVVLLQMVWSGLQQQHHLTLTPAVVNSSRMSVAASAGLTHSTLSSFFFSLSLQWKMGSRCTTMYLFVHKLVTTNDGQLGHRVVVNGGCDDRGWWHFTNFSSGHSWDLL